MGSWSASSLCGPDPEPVPRRAQWGLAAGRGGPKYRSTAGRTFWIPTLLPQLSTQPHPLRSPSLPRSLLPQGLCTGPLLSPLPAPCASSHSLGSQLLWHLLQEASGTQGQVPSPRRRCVFSVCRSVPRWEVGVVNPAGVCLAWGVQSRRGRKRSPVSRSPKPRTRQEPGWGRVGGPGRRREVSPCVPPQAPAPGSPQGLLSPGSQPARPGKLTRPRSGWGRGSLSVRKEDRWRGRGGAHLGSCPGT